MILKTLLGSLAACLALTAAMAYIIRDSAVPLIFLYPQEVQDIVVGEGLSTPEQIRKNGMKFTGIMYVILFGGLFFTWHLTGAQSFSDCWWQTVAFIWFYNLYDALIIDAYWVRKTGAWQIPGAEGMDYIPYGSKTKARIALMIIALPLAAVIAWLYTRL